MGLLVMDAQPCSQHDEMIHAIVNGQLKNELLAPKAPYTEVQVHKGFAITPNAVPKGEIRI